MDVAIVEVQDVVSGPSAPYQSLLERAETMREFVLDGTLDPEDALALSVWPTEAVEDAMRAFAKTRRSNAQIRYTEDARAQALALVAGGASLRLAAAAALGNARYRMKVWRWVKESSAH